MKKIKITGIILASLLFLHFTGTITYADESILYTVKQGDTLWNIAISNNTTINNLKRLNNLETDFLKIGQKLIIKETSNVNTNNSLNTVTTRSLPSSIYTVKSGDTLWGIATTHNTTVANLQKLNNLSSYNLYVGQQLLLSSEEAVLPSAPSTPSRGGVPFTGDRIVEVATQYLGTPYLYGGQSPSGFDCSGFVKYVFSKFEINLNRTAAGQYSQGIPVGKENLAVGDLVFFACGSNTINHVGIYSGNGQFIHSSSPRSGGVIYSSLNEGYYARNYVGAKRVLN